MRIAVTGATSMIGVALIKQAIQNNVEVLAFVRENSSRLDRLPKSDKIIIIPCDINNLFSFETGDLYADVFYHMAWNYTDRADRNNPILQAKNIQITLDAVELAYKLGCKKFVGAGSQAEYGRGDDIISENTKADPDTPYGISKFSAGKLARKLCDQYAMKFIWGRIFSVYGVNDNDGTMLNYAIDQFYKGESAQLSSCTQIWNYLYEEDAGMYFYLLGLMDVPDGIYCIAHNESMILKKYIQILQDVFGEGAYVTFTDDTQNDKVLNLRVDTSKVICATNYKPRISFQKGIETVVQYRKLK